MLEIGDIYKNNIVIFVFDSGRLLFWSIGQKCFWVADNTILDFYNGEIFFFQHRSGYFLKRPGQNFTRTRLELGSIQITAFTPLTVSISKPWRQWIQSVYGWFPANNEGFSIDGLENIVLKDYSVDFLSDLTDEDRVELGAESSLNHHRTPFVQSKVNSKESLSFFSYDNFLYTKPLWIMKHGTWYRIHEGQKFKGSNIHLFPWDSWASRSNHRQVQFKREPAVQIEYLLKDIGPTLFPVPIEYIRNIGKEPGVSNGHSIHPVGQA
jgi:hypothetical protein